MTNDNLDNEYNSDSYYPEKPNFEESENKNKISVISILWFIGLSYWFFDHDWVFVFVYNRDIDRFRLAHVQK